MRIPLQVQVLFGETRKTLFTHQPIKFLQIVKAIKPEIPKTKLLILSEVSELIMKRHVSIVT